jgi:hypothetical protein
MSGRSFLPGLKDRPSGGHAFQAAGETNPALADNPAQFSKLVAKSTRAVQPGVRFSKQTCDGLAVVIQSFQHAPRQCDARRQSGGEATNFHSVFTHMPQRSFGAESCRTPHGPAWVALSRLILLLAVWPDFNREAAAKAGQMPTSQSKSYTWEKPR